MRKRSFFILCILILLAFSWMGCGNRQEKAGGYHIYYLNKERTKLMPAAYDPEGKSGEEMIDDMIQKLSQTPESLDYKRPFAADVEILSWSLEMGQLQLTFGTDYSRMNQIEEVLCRAAVTRTLMQVEGVECITFYVGDVPLMDKNGTPIGLMTAESFIENPGEQINSIQTATITLYFSNVQGDGLIQEIQECHYNSNISMEKLVMEQLMKGPIGVNGVSTIPSGTKLVSVSVLDGVCLVNLDEGFLNQNYGIEEGVVIYSIVDSLAELPNINKIQISVNGDTSITYRDKFSLSTLYERNLDYLQSVRNNGDETKEGQEGGAGG